MAVGIDGSGLCVCVPTYNERDNLPRQIARLRSSVPAAHILVIDDGSPDGTGSLADALAAADPQLHVLHRSAKAGLGAAYVAGFAWALQRGFQAVAEMDADGSHDPADLPRLLAALADADVALGSRWVPGGQVRNWPRSRMLLSRGGNAYTRLALGIPVRDATGGYRVYADHVLRALPLTEIASQGYCFQVDLVWRALRAGFRLREVPITFTERELGESKMNRAIVLEALWRVTQWGAARALHRPDRAAGPAATSGRRR